MNHIDLAFTVTTRQSIPVDHGYALYGAVSRVLPDVHRENGVAIHPLRGRQIGDRMLSLMPWSTLTLRVPADQIAPVLPLAGKTLRLGESALRVGVPEVHALEPASVLRSRLVVIKVAHTSAAELIEENFLAAARKQLAELGVSDQVNVIIPRRPKSDQPRRRTLRIKDAEIVGYEVIVEGLTAAESLMIQERGLGGRQHMGCGVFVAYTPAKEVSA